MNSNIDFSECLNKLMHATSLKNSKLAKAINVDASLIYKWLNNKAIPPYNSQHIDMIADQIMKNIINSCQSRVVEDIIKENLISCPEINDKNMLDFLRKLLIESQGCSIEKKKSIKKNLISKNQELIDIKPFMENPIYAFQNSPILSQSTFSKVEIITGHEEVLNTALELLETANTVNIISTEPIMITLFSEMEKFPFHSDFNIKWKDSICKAIKKGWNITYHIRINNNSYRNIKIIEDMLVPISTGKYQVYYSSNNDYTPPFEIVLVPRVGTLFCVSSVDKHQVDSAFLIKNKNAQNIFKGLFYQLLTSSKPLLKPYMPIESIGFQKEYPEIEEIPGNRYCFKWGLSTPTIPISLYEKVLKKSNISAEEVEKKFLYYKRRIKAFESQIKHYKFRSIISDEYILNLINKKECCLFDKYYTSNELILTNDDIIEHLSHTIYLLKSYENFEIGLVSKNEVSSLSITDWMVKEHSTVLVITYIQGNLDLPGSNQMTKTAKEFIVSESNMTKAFEYYFDSLWSQIHPAKRNKKELISMLENYIKLLSSN